MRILEGPAVAHCGGGPGKSFPKPIFMRRLLLVACLLNLAFSARAQQLRYRILDQNPEVNNTFIHFQGSMDLNSVNGIGFNLGLQGYHIMDDDLPLTLRGRYQRELWSGGEGSDFDGQGDDPLREMEYGGSFRLLGGNTTTDRADLKVVLSQSYRNGYEYNNYNKVPAGRTNELLGCLSVYHWGARDMRTTGLAAGIAVRSRKHTRIDLPTNPDSSEGAPELQSLGYRLGYQEYKGTYSFIYELSLRPGAPNLQACLSLGMTYGWDFLW
jgi:hypothetical protein